MTSDGSGMQADFDGHQSGHAKVARGGNHADYPDGDRPYDVIQHRWCSPVSFLYLRLPLAWMPPRPLRDEQISGMTGRTARFVAPDRKQLTLRFPKTGALPARLSTLS